jgi:hypothetical protein
MAKQPSALDGNQVLQHSFDDVTGSLRQLDLGGLTPVEHDEIALTYITSGNGTGEIGTVVYKLATVTQATLTLTYDATNRLINVVRS